MYAFRCKGRIVKDCFILFVMIHPLFYSPLDALQIPQLDSSRFGVDPLLLADEGGQLVDDFRYMF